MELHLLKGRQQTGYTTFGSYWEKGELRQDIFELRNEQGMQTPVQSRIMARWPDGSIKWCAHTADSGKMGQRVTLLPVQTDQKGQKHADAVLRVQKTMGGYQVYNGDLFLYVPAAPSSSMTGSVYFAGRKVINAMYPVFRLEHRWEKRLQPGSAEEYEYRMHPAQETAVIQYRENREYRGRIDSVELEEDGPLQAVFCFRGRHVQGESASMPFVIRMYLNSGSREIRFVHTFLFDGKEERDFLKGMGIRADRCMTGPLYDRHIQFGTDGASFHEAAVLLASSHPRLSPEILERQLAGERIVYGEGSDVEAAAAKLPVWNRYAICQDSAFHYQIDKQTSEECCELTCREGKRAPGVMAVADGETELMFGIRDFWQKNPSGLEAEGLKEDSCGCTIWFYSPKAEAFDFRHYALESYPQTCYEGFDYVAADAYGIGVTSEAFVAFENEVSSCDQLSSFALRIQKPPVYAAAPEFYYEKRTFGYWSLPAGETEAQAWLEKQLEQAFSFYQKETEERNWYGLFNYGDIMHTYDNVRHVWRYDMGGFAWQNTELVPTYWLWIYFLRTGREDVFSFAEAMSRHCSEVDVYHFGKLKGLGSRHNVRHWGCSCKEPRIAMAGHHRFLYYLTGDRRLGDVFQDVKDADFAMARIPHGNEGVVSAQAEVRSGPDWSSFVSNWMTWYEITLDEAYRRRIENGIADIAATPYGFASGPDFYYDLKEGHLIYRGEIEDTPNQHLQICMGGPQIWLETADMLENEELKRLLVRLGGFYFLSRAEKIRLTDGTITKRNFGWPMLAAGVTAYSAMKKKDPALAKLTWQVLLSDLKTRIQNGNFDPVTYAKGADGTAAQEIPGITTNFTSQWCLNVIMCLEFIREALPETTAELKKYMELGGIDN